MPLILTIPTSMTESTWQKWLKRDVASDAFWGRRGFEAARAPTVQYSRRNSIWKCLRAVRPTDRCLPDAIRRRTAGCRAA